MKICDKCQTEYPDDMAFCSHCGTPLQPKVQEVICPACGKVLGKEKLQFCPYCGQKLNSSETIKSDTDSTGNVLRNASKTTDLENSIEPEKTSDFFTRNDIIVLVVATILSTLALSTAFGFARGIVTGLMFVLGRKFYKQKRYVAMAGVIIVALLANIGLKYALGDNLHNSKNVTNIHSSKNSTVNNYGDVGNSPQIKDFKVKYNNIPSKLTEPNLKSLYVVKNKIFKTEDDAYNEITLRTKKIAKDAIKLLTNKDLNLYCALCTDYYQLQGSQYVIVTTYCYPDTVTYPQKEILDYWALTISDKYVNDKYYKANVTPSLQHIQFNTKTNEFHILEGRKVVYTDNVPKLISESVSKEHNKYVLTDNSWQKLYINRFIRFLNSNH